MVITTLLCSSSFVATLRFGIFFFTTVLIVDATSCHTVNPRPADTIRNIVVKLISGELTYSIKLLFPIISTPALQNAEIEWKIPYQIPLITPNSGINLIMNSTAPIPSTRNVPFKILMINLTIPDRVSKPYACWINILPFILMRFPRIRKKDAVHAITPSPPICIRIIIMN